MDIFPLAFGFAVIVYLLGRTLSCLKCRQQEYYPPWTGVRPWLHAAYAGALWGTVVWLVVSYNEFLSALFKEVDFALAEFKFIETFGFYVAIFLPSTLFLPVFKSVRRIYSWIAVDWNAADKKSWHLMFLRAFACTGVMAGTGAAFTLALPALLRALF